MIITAGLTPAWQQIMRFDSLRAGEVNRATEVCWCASGKVLNVAIALSRLGAPLRAIAPLGRPALGLIDDEFAAEGIDRRWIEVRQPTRVCTTILEKETGQVTELVQNAAPLEQVELAQFATAFEDSVAGARWAVLTGSLPGGTPPTFFRDLKLPPACRLVLDIRGPELIAALDCRPWVVKPNRQELAATLGADLTLDARLHEAMREINQRGAEWIVVSSGAGPVWARCRDGLYRFQVPTIVPVNPIGSGDCLAAGIVWGLYQNKAMPEAIRLGIAAAVDNAGRLLPARINPQTVEAQAETIVGERV